MRAQNLKQLNRSLNKISTELAEQGKFVKTKVGRVLFSGANDIRNDILRGMSQSKRASHFYKRGTIKHFPSLPDNSPVTDQGGMARSILYDVYFWRMYVGSTMDNPPYPAMHEEGIRYKKVGRQRRPWLEPAVNKNEDKIINNMAKVTMLSIDRAMQKAGLL